jgi:hypothetical protein
MLFIRGKINIKIMDSSTRTLEVFDIERVAAETKEITDRVEEVFFG